MTLPKLVRDRIPAIIRHKDKLTAVTHRADDDEFRARLLDKCAEEAEEVRGAFAAKNRDAVIEEVADLLEVVSALVDHVGFAQVQHARQAKALKSGKFNLRTVLDEIV